MNKILIVFILAIILAGTGLVIYFQYEKPTQEVGLVYANINIKALHDGEQVPVDYKIIIDNYGERSGRTLSTGYILEKILVNSTVSVENVNSSEYYKVVKNLNIDKEDNYRVDLNLEKIGAINVTHKLDFNKPSEVLLTTKSTGIYKNMRICSKWSIHILNVEILNFSDGKRIEGYDRCFNIDKTLNNEIYNFSIKYNTWGQIDERDYIILYLVDEADNILEYKINDIWKLNG